MGEDCSAAIPCEDDCSGRGMCVHGACHCSPGWSGVDCSQPLPCPNGCSAHGVCAHGHCHCDRGYTADDCSVLVQTKTVVEFCRSGVASVSVGVLAAGVVAGVLIAGVVAQRRRARLIRFINTQ